jgi:hypothetical protein
VNRARNLRVVRQAGNFSTRLALSASQEGSVLRGSYTRVIKLCAGELHACKTFLEHSNRVGELSQNSSPCLRFVS